MEFLVEMLTFIVVNGNRLSLMLCKMKCLTCCFRVCLLLVTCFLFSSSWDSLQYRVQVETFGDYSIGGRSFFIIPADEQIEIHDLEFKEYASYVSVALQYWGAIETEDYANADLCILIDYNITDQSYTEKIPKRIRGVVGLDKSTYSTSNTTSNSTGDLYGSAYASSGSARANVYGNETTNSQTNTFSTTSSTPVYGTIGYTTIEKHVEKHLRVLNIYAYDNKRENEYPLVWKTNVTSDGSSNNLRKVMPMLGFSLIATNKPLGKKRSADYFLDEDNESFRLYSRAVDNKNTTTVKPKILSSSLRVEYVFREDNSLCIVVNSMNKKDFKPNKSMYIIVDGIRYPIVSFENKVSALYSDKGNDYYFSELVFPPIPGDARMISIYDKKGLIIPDIHIVR